ncbi:MAG: M23 family metallopeptidase [Erysipelotrichia bacterium]|nr:M23 family metallopeptidase [Erysipelotrichia bacterium]
MKKTFFCLAIFVAACVFLCVFANAGLYAANPFEEKDLYLVGDTYKKKFGEVKEIKVEDAMVTVVIKNDDGTTETVTENEKLVEESEKTVTGDKSSGDKKNTVKKITYGTVRVDTSLNVRSSPWGTVIDSFHEGDVVKIIDRVGAWYRIAHNGQIAFIHSNYVESPGAPAGQVPVIYPWQMNVKTESENTDPSVTTGSGRFGAAPCSPMPSYASSEYGMRKHPTTGQYTMHNGIDLPVPSGTRLNALGDGTVVAVAFESGGGNYIKVRYDNGYESFYCHLQKSTVTQGQRVSMGQEIAKSDNTGIYTTGAHLHFGLKLNGNYVNPRSAGLPLP